MELEFDMVDVDIGRAGQVINYRDDIALIDADTILYASATTCEVKNELFSRDFYTDEEWIELMNDPSYDEDEHATYELDLEVAYEHAMDKVQGILDETGCREYELHFTDGRKSFRYKLVNKEYKANRTGRSPVRLLELKELFIERQPDKAFLWKEWEADDIVVAKKNEWPNKYLLVALDKDVLYSLPGRHFNYYSSTLYNKSMHFFEVSEEQALKHHYKQTLTGDTGDGIYGLKGIGPKKADKILADCSTHKECWEAVLKAYDEIGVLKNGKEADEVDAITNMRLVSMNQLKLNRKTNKWEVHLWKPVK